MTKIKLSKQELTEMVQRSISKVLKENWSDDMLGTQQHDIEQSDIYNNNESKNPKKIKLKLSELREIIKNVIKEENTK